MSDARHRLPAPWTTGSPSGPADPAHPDAWWVLFDGECAMCRRLVGVLERLDVDRGFVAVAGDDPRVAARLPWLDRGAVARALQVVAPDGRTWEAAAAVEVIVARLPRGRWLAPLFVLPGVRGLTERGYRIVARNRHRLGCGEHCAAVSPRRASS